MTQIIFKDYEPELFKVTTYPDGQRSVDLYRDKIDVKKPVTIKCRIKDFNDLEVLLCLVAALRKYDYYIEAITFIYLFGMRSDRSFTGNDCNYFRDVVAPIINSMQIPRIKVFAPHNQTTLNYINGKVYEIGHNETFSNKIILMGDESATFITKSIFLSQAQDVFSSFEKKRMQNGLISVELPNIGCINAHNDVRVKTDTLYPILIMDDLCDAGGTFIAEAEYLAKNLRRKNELMLFVAHGLFTKGLEIILHYFNKIITTNSYQDIVHPNVHQIKVI